MKKIVAGTLLALAVMALVVYLVVVRPLVSPAAETSAAEAALATPDVVVLAAMNVRQAVFLERWLLGAPAEPAASPASARPLEQRTLLEHLTAAHVDVRHDVDEVLYALYPAAGDTTRQALVVVGHFDVASLEQYLVGELHATPHPGVGHAYDVRRANPAVCDDVSTWTISVDPRWMLVTDPASHVMLVARLTQAPAADSGQLAWWRPLAHSDVLSVGIWRPRDVERTTTAPALQASARAASVQIDSVEHLYLGVGARPMPPSGRLRLVLDAADGTRLRQKVDAWQQMLRQSRGQWAATAPSVAALFDSLSVTTETNRETIAFVVDRTLVRNAQRAVNELIGLIFSGFTGGRRPAPAVETATERLDPAPPVFVPVAASATLSPYDPAAMFAEDVDDIQGPIGVRLGALRLGSDPAVGLELVVEAFSAAIPNVVDPGRRVQLFVDSVTTSTGQEVLRTEPCGRQRNREPAEFTAPGGGRLRAAKVVRLVPGVDPHTLRAVGGHVELRLPSRVETLSVTHPAAGATLTSHGTTVTVTKIEGGVVGYQITGVPDRVLHLGALNAAGQPLASTSSFKGDFFFGDGVAGETHYAGQVDRVTAVFAVDEEAVRWPFTLTDFSMAGKAPSVKAPPPPEFRPYGLQALRRDVPRGNPFELSFDRAQTMFTTRLDFTLRSPALPNLEHAYTVGRLKLTRIELNDGSVLTPPVAAAAGARPAAWETALRFGTTPKDGVLTKSLYLLVDAKPAPETIRAVAGVLTLQLPRTIRTLRVEDLTPGSEAATAGMSVTVTARGHRSLTLRAAANGERVLHVALTAVGGQPVASFNPTITESPDGAWTFQLSPYGAPAYADVTFATSVERKDYPFRLERP